MSRHRRHQSRMDIDKLKDAARFLAKIEGCNCECEVTFDHHPRYGEPVIRPQVGHHAGCPLEDGGVGIAALVHLPPKDRRRH